MTLLLPPHHAIRGIRVNLDIPHQPHLDPAMPTPAGFSLPVCAHAHRYRLHPAEWHKPHFSA